MHDHREHCVGTDLHLVDLVLAEPFAIHARSQAIHTHFDSHVSEIGAFLFVKYMIEGHEDAHFAGLISSRL